MQIDFYRSKVVVVGSGAAGLNTAIQLHAKGIEDVIIITDKWGGGTSNNAGSDKQTYYRLAPDHEEGDHSMRMAKTLFNGGAMHGDIALVEATESLRAFHHLVSLGVPFPKDQYGRFPGYITDHDSVGRGTSAGPLTSKFMFDALAQKIVDLQIPIIANHQVIQLVKQSENDQEKICGLIAINLEKKNSGKEAVVAFEADQVVLATGGPGELFMKSVYPAGQVGSMGLAVSAGAKLTNLTEMQFGIASLHPRWNLSGSYQQVVPRYYSQDNQGNVFEFLNAQYPNPQDLSLAIFLKGYQWPFDPQKIKGGGSSLIDLSVYNEIEIKGRRVFLDYTRNPILADKTELSTADFHPKISEYLARSSSILPDPIDRLASLNKPAIDLYRSKGLNLYKNPVEIDICAQHCNGGIAIDHHWESSIPDLFAVGEVSGTHGIYRPGGSALNSGQVGGFRIAERIASGGFSKAKKGNGMESIGESIQALEVQWDYWMASGIQSSIRAKMDELKNRMSKFAGPVRSLIGVETGLQESATQLNELLDSSGFLPEEIASLESLRSRLLSERLFLTAIQQHILNEGLSRGSFLVVNAEQGFTDSILSGEINLEDDAVFTQNNVLELTWEPSNQKSRIEWRPIRPIPTSDLWFERVWNEFRNNKKQKK